MLPRAVAKDGEGAGGASGRLGSGDDARLIVRCLWRSSQYMHYLMIHEAIFPKTMSKHSCSIVSYS
jgi:hypothetical protein